MSGQLRDAGTYTPTVTGVTNVDAVTAYACQWCRIGACVIVSGKFDVDPTATAATEVGISLPIPSNFSTAQQCGGTANAPVTQSESAGIRADTTNDRAQVSWTTGTTNNHEMDFIFMYSVTA